MYEHITVYACICVHIYIYTVGNFRKFKTFLYYKGNVKFDYIYDILE